MAAFGALNLPVQDQNDDQNVPSELWVQRQIRATPNSLSTKGTLTLRSTLSCSWWHGFGGVYLCNTERCSPCGLVSNWSENSDGSVTLTGMEYGYDAVAGGWICQLPASVTLRAGGVGSAA